MLDKLTQVCNRWGFYQFMDDMMREVASTNSRFAVLIIDFHHFSDINTTAGLSAGDEVLKTSARRIKKLLREHDILGRVGDDEFAVLIPNMKNPALAQLAAAKISEVLKQPIKLDRQVVTVKPSIGIAYYPDHAKDREGLCCCAHSALLAARRGHADFSVYAPSDAMTEGHDLYLEQDLRIAIDKNELELYFQPKVDCRSGEVVSVEALLRWNSKNYGKVSPEIFIPLAESTGMIRELSYWVLKAAVAQNVRWLKQGVDVTVAVNLSADGLHELELPHMVQQVLQLWGLPPEKLVLEITEGSLITDPQAALAILKRISAMGVKTSIDDFGTGYSSLAYLKQLPVDELKIDKSFVQDMSSDEGDAMIVRSIIDLARNFKLRVVAEGVEDRQTWKCLTDMGCDVLQGYYFSAPQPPDAIPDLMLRRPWLARLDLNDNDADESSSSV